MMNKSLTSSQTRPDTPSSPEIFSTTFSLITVVYITPTTITTICRMRSPKMSTSTLLKRRMPGLHLWTRRRHEYLRVFRPSTMTMSMLRW